MICDKIKHRKKNHGIWRHLILAVLGVILGVNIYMSNANHLLGNKLPMPFGYGVAVVLSGSMEPTLSKDDLIFVKKSDTIDIGDIVVYQTDGVLVVHRAIAIDGEMVTTWGDANNIADPTFEKSAVMGVVIGWIPRVGVVVNAIKTPEGTIMVLVCAFLMIELSFRKQKEKDEEEREAIKDEIRKLKEK